MKNYVQCKICDKIMKRAGFRPHLHYKHQLDSSGLNIEMKKDGYYVIKNTSQIIGTPSSEDSFSLFSRRG